MEYLNGFLVIAFALLTACLVIVDIKIAFFPLIFLLLYYVLNYQLLFFILLLFIIFSDVFGIFGVMGLPSIKTSIGSLWLKDILFLSLTVVFLNDIFVKKKEIKKGTFSFLLILLLLLTCLQVIRSLLIENTSFHYTFKIARPFIYYLLYLIFINKFYQQKHFDAIVKFIIFVGFIIATLTVMQSFLGFPLLGGSKSVELAGLDFARVYQNNIDYTLLGLLLLLSKENIFKHQLISYAFSIIYLLFTMFMFIGIYSRGALYIFLFSLIMFFIFNIQYMAKSLKVIFGVALIIIFFALTTTVFQDYYTPLKKRINSGINDLRNKEGTFGQRIKLAKQAAIIAMNDSVLLGAGFRYEKYVDIECPTDKLIHISPYSWIGTDNGASYILFRQGIIGLLIYISLFALLFYKGGIFLLKTINRKAISLILSLLIYNVCCIMFTIISNPLAKSQPVIVILTSWYLFDFIIKNGQEIKIKDTHNFIGY